MPQDDRPTFPWDQAPEATGGYITVDPRVLEALRELLWIHLVNKHHQPILRLILQVVRVDPTSGNVVVNARLVRDLDEGEAEHGLGSI